MIKITQGIPAGASQIDEIAVTATIQDLEFLSGGVVPAGGMAAGFEIDLALIDTLLTKLRGTQGRSSRPRRGR